MKLDRSEFVCKVCEEKGRDVRVVISVVADGQSYYLARCPVCAMPSDDAPDGTVSRMQLEHPHAKIAFPSDPKSDVHIVAATTMRTPIVTLAYHSSMMMAPRVLRDAGMQFSELQLPGGSIQFGRNRLVSAFLNRTTASHLLMVDDDIRFDPKDIVRFVKFDRDVVAGAYATREIDWDRAATMATHGAAPSDLKRGSSPLAARFLPGAGGKVIRDEEHPDLLEAEYVSTGFLLIKREVLARMVEFYRPSLEYFCAEDNEDQVAIFEAGVRERRPFSEDTLWSKRWREELGGRLWIDGRSSFGHNGEYEFWATPALEQLERAKGLAAAAAAE